MRRYRFEIILAACFLLIAGTAWLWQNPSSILGRLGEDEIAHYMAAVERLPIPADERAGVLRAVRAWMESDDGRPVYMLNLMRYYPELHHIEGGPPFNGTPRESNEHYESVVRPMLFAQGGYPLYAGNVQGHNLNVHDPELDDWSRVLLVRYPSRRAFMNLMCDPAYREVVPYKLMALSVVLTPTTRELVIPPLHWLVGVALLIAFLAIGCWRAATRLPRR